MYIVYCLFIVLFKNGYFTCCFWIFGIFWFVLDDSNLEVKLEPGTEELLNSFASEVRQKEYSLPYSGNWA